MKTTSKILIDPMEIAFKEAKKAYENNEVPVGAVITDSYGNIISRAFNLVETQQDPTAHAEILAIKKATVKVGNKRLTDCNLYVTLEPCSMCASAIEQSRIKETGSDIVTAHNDSSRIMGHGGNDCLGCHHHMFRAFGLVDQRLLRF